MAKHSLNSTIIYRILTWGFFPVAFAHSLVTAIKFNCFTYFSQRLGIYTQLNFPKDAIWCHCASVGEFNTALPLLRKLIANNYHLIISTNTVTGRQTFHNANLKNAHHVFLPLDYNSFVNRFLKTHLPKYCLLFETELWPNILLSTLRHSISISIINGRISDKTLHAPNFLKDNYKRILSNADHVFASSPENADRFISLGANKSDVKIFDNLKYANLIQSENDMSHCPITHSFLLCASTHEGEEIEILQHWHQINSSTLGLVIAARHPHRSKEVCKIIQSLGFTYKIHSQQPKDISASEIYVIDTVGDLIPFINQAEIVFMGGSLVPIGGHNVLEPAQFGKCILTGPHTHNFTEITQDLLTCNGIKVVQDGTQLINEVNNLLINNQTRLSLGENAKNFVVTKKHVLDDYLTATLKILN